MRVALALLLTVAAGCCWAEARKPLTEAEAIRRAEEFIRENGYTDLPPREGRLDCETVEWKKDRDSLLKRRYDTLERKAFAVARHRKGGVPGWSVAFRQKAARSGPDGETGRAVTMDPDGGNMRLEHLDITHWQARKK